MGGYGKELLKDTLCVLKLIYICKIARTSLCTIEFTSSNNIICNISSVINML